MPQWEKNGKIWKIDQVITILVPNFPHKDSKSFLPNENWPSAVKTKDN